MSTTINVGATDQAASRGPGDRPLEVVIAPDSLKGTITAYDAAQALAAGWREARPLDKIRCLPQADGGEGTAAVLAGVLPGAHWRATPEVLGPDGRRVPGRYLSLRDGTAVVDLASVSGIGLMAKLDPLGAQTVGLGQVLRRAVQDGATRISMGVGGSASTDGGLGALTALGVRAIGPGRRPLPTGGGNLIDLVAVETAFLLDPPPGGVEILADVDIPLLGPGGAAAVFGPQKGAGPAEIAQLDAGLARFAALLGGDPSAPGAGAAGGTGYGFATAWGARFVPGASRIAELSGLVGALASADVLILGEGRLDATSLAGKVVGNGLRISSRVPWRFIVAGHVELEADQAAPDVRTVSLTDLAGSAEYSMAHPAEILTKAGAAIAREVTTAA